MQPISMGTILQSGIPGPPPGNGIVGFATVARDVQAISTLKRASENAIELIEPREQVWVFLRTQDLHRIHMTETSRGFGPRVALC
jgi:hypothetical protein